MLRRVMRLVSFALVLAPVAAPARASAPPLPRPTWCTVVVGPFVVFTDGRPAVARSIADDLEAMRASLAAFTSLDVTSRLPTRVFVFADSGSARPYLDAILGHPARDVGGLFLPTPDGALLVVDASRRAEMAPIAHHELVHAYVADTAVDVPLWLAEGLAEFYSTFTLDGATVELGAPIAAHLALLRERPHLPLGRLFAITAGSREYAERGTRQMFDAESWAFVHGVMTGPPERKVRLARFVAALAAGTPLDRAFESAFGTTLEAAGRDLATAVRNPSMAVMRVPVATLRPDTAPPPRPMAYPEVLAALGDLLAHGPEPGSNGAEALLLEAVRRDPAAADAHAGLGRIAAAAGRHEEAVTHFEAAVRGAPRSYRPFLLFGEYLVAEAARTRGDAAGPPAAAVARARDLFRAGLERAPEIARLHAGLGRTYLIRHEDDVGPGIAALERARELAPNDRGAAADLARLYGRVGQAAKGRAEIARVLARSGDAAWAGRARETLVWEQLDRARRLADGGRHADALGALEEVTGGADATSPARFADFIARLRAVVLYNIAVDRSNAGDWATALDMAERVLAAGVGDEEMLRAARDLRARIRPFVEKQRGAAPPAAP